MKRYAVFSLILCLLAAHAYAFAQVDLLMPGLWEAESETLLPYYTGEGWVQVVDGDYQMMESTAVEDSVSFPVSGSQLVIYRELLSEGAATAEICIDSACTSLTSESSIDQRSVPIAYPVEDGSEVTITNVDGGTLRLDSFLLLSRSELHEQPAPDPAREYVVLPDGTLAAVDRTLTGGEIVQIALSAAQIVLLVLVVVLLAWKK